MTVSCANRDRTSESMRRALVRTHAEYYDALRDIIEVQLRGGARAWTRISVVRCNHVGKTGRRGEEGGEELDMFRALIGGGD